MKFLGNVVWFIFGGFFGFIAWLLAGLFWCFTIIGIPIGLQCFKIAGLSIAPFGKELVYEASGVNLFMNILWLLFSGIPLALGHLMSALLLTITIVGIPFAKQSIKLARLSLMPFGVRIVSY